MLSVEGIDVYIQASHVLRRISLEVREREVVCLVGRNSAGKTTTLPAIMGYLKPRGGRIAFRGQDIQGKRTCEIARKGLGFAPENSGIFSDPTVAENIEISTWTRPGGRPAGERIERAYRVFPGLRRYVARKGPEMSGGERKMPSIARALALDPDMLLLDEPFEGLPPAIIPAVSEGLSSITGLGHSILMAESNIHYVPEFAARLYVIERGEIIFAGRPADVHADRSAMRVIGGRGVTHGRRIGAGRGSRGRSSYRLCRRKWRTQPMKGETAVASAPGRRPVSEYGRLCHVDGTPREGSPPPEVVHVAFYEAAGRVNS